MPFGRDIRVVLSSTVLESAPVPDGKGRFKDRDAPFAAMLPIANYSCLLSISGQFEPTRPPHITTVETVSMILAS